MKWSFFQLALASLFISQPAWAYTTHLLQPEDQTGNMSLNLEDFDYMKTVLEVNMSEEHEGEQSDLGDLHRVLLELANTTTAVQTTPPTTTIPPDNTTVRQYCSTTEWEQFQKISSDVHGWLALMVCMFGSIANVINIVVLSQRSMLTPTNAILRGLAITDMLVMIEYIPFCIHEYLWIRSKIEHYTWSWTVFVLFHSHFAQVFHTISILLTVTLAVWRYIALAQPQYNSEWCSMERANIAILSSIVISVIFNIPIYLNFSISAVPYEGSTLYIVGFSELAKNTSLKDWNMWLYSVLLKLLPCLALSVLSLALARGLRNAGRRRAALMTARGGAAEAERQAARVTRLLLAILVLFLMSELPQGVLGLLVTALPKAGFFSCYRKLGDVMDMLVLFNSAVNFILYCVMSQQFRTTFSQLCANYVQAIPSCRCSICCARNRPSADVSTHGSTSNNTGKTFV